MYTVIEYRIRLEYCDEGTRKKLKTLSLVLLDSNM